jgi:hypothetical protein
MLENVVRSARRVVERYDREEEAQQLATSMRDSVTYTGKPPPERSLFGTVLALGLLGASCDAHRAGRDPSARACGADDTQERGQATGRRPVSRPRQE